MKTHIGKYTIVPRVVVDVWDDEKVEIVQTFFGTDVATVRERAIRWAKQEMARHVPQGEAE